MRVGRLGRCLVILMPVALIVPVGPTRSAGATSTPALFPESTHAATSRLASLPLAFEPNVGRADPSVRYLAHGAGFTLFLTDRGAVTTYTASYNTDSRASVAPLDSRVRLAGRSLSTATLRLFPIHAAHRPQVVASDPQPGRVNYFIGNDPSKWHIDVPTFARITYRNIYPGIDLVFHGPGGRLEYDWVVKPHADPRRVLMQVDGARRAQLQRDGSVALTTAAGGIRQMPPRIYQTVAGKRVMIRGSFRLLPHGRLGLRLHDYDPDAALIVDPVLAYSSYFGTGSGVSVNGVAADNSGDMFLTGTVQAAALIPIKNAYRDIHRGGVDGFVAKINTNGTGLVYSTYFGGDREDDAYAVAVDDAGNAYVAGTTASPNFAVGQLEEPGGNFVLKFGPNGDRLVYAHVDYTDPKAAARAVAVDSSGNAYYAGDTIPLDRSGPDVMFVGVLDAAGKPMGPTYTAGTDTRATGIAVDPQGNIFVAGVTSDPNFPMFGAINPTFGGDHDAFVMMLDGGMQPIWSTFLGGSKYDAAAGIALDPTGNVYVSGQTLSSNFPTANPYQSKLKGLQDAFVTELTHFGTGYVYSTYLGGLELGAETATGIAVDSMGSAYVAGYSSAPNYPVVDPPAGGGSWKGAQDAFITELAPGGASLNFSTLLGGAQDDKALGIALDSQRNVFLGGTTASTAFPLTASGDLRTLEGTQVGFAAELSAAPSPPPTAMPSPTPTPTATTVPPPPPPKIALASSKVNAGSKVKVSVTTVPHAAVAVTLQVTQHGAIAFGVSKAGQANDSGTYTRSIKVAFHPAKKVKARVTVQVTTAGGSATNSVTVTILPHA